MGTRDRTGRQGEAAAIWQLMDFCGQPEPYFDAHPLGDKCPTYDLLVELVNAGDSPPYFLAQVKTSRGRYTDRGAALKVAVPASEVRKMVRCPIPTYLLGVDLAAAGADFVFLASVHGDLAGPVSSIPRRHPLTPTNLRTLWEEVKDYWASLDPARKTSAFPLREAGHG